jgi:predicted RNA binding protein YcfA (HicA-like mRNA interferase family)
MSLRPLPYREIKQRLEKAGFRIVGQKGSHVKFAKEADGKVRTAIVPNHKDVATGTIRSILRQAGITASEFGF